MAQKQSIFFLDPKIWELLPSNIKDSENLNIFESNFTSWKPGNLPCLLCRLYIADTGCIELYFFYELVIIYF